MIDNTYAINSFNYHLMDLIDTYIAGKELDGFLGFDKVPGFEQLYEENWREIVAFYKSNKNLLREPIHQSFIEVKKFEFLIKENLYNKLNEHFKQLDEQELETIIRNTIEFINIDFYKYNIPRENVLKNIESFIDKQIGFYIERAKQNAKLKKAFKAAEKNRKSKNKQEYEILERKVLEIINNFEKPRWLNWLRYFFRKTTQEAVFLLKTTFDEFDETEYFYEFSQSKKEVLLSTLQFIIKKENSNKLNKHFQNSIGEILNARSGEYVKNYAQILEKKNKAVKYEIDLLKTTKGNADPRGKFRSVSKPKGYSKAKASEIFKKFKEANIANKKKGENSPKEIVTLSKSDQKAWALSNKYIANVKKRWNKTYQVFEKTPDRESSKVKFSDDPKVQVIEVLAGYAKKTRKKQRGGEFWRDPITMREHQDIINKAMEAAQKPEPEKSSFKKRKDPINLNAESETKISAFLLHVPR